MEQLQLKDIACYLPYGLKLKYEESRIIWSIDPFADETNYDDEKLQLFHVFDEAAKPLLRPMSMLYKTIVHDGKEEVPIVVLAKMAVPEIGMTELVIPKNDIHTPLLYCNNGHSTIEFYWHDNGCFIADGWECGQLDINQWKLMDYLASRLFDFRGLIEKGLAIKMEG